MNFSAVNTINEVEEEYYFLYNSLKTFEKVLETVVKQQLENYMGKNKLLPKYQSGFRKKFSCETVINYVASRWKNAKNCQCNAKNEKILALIRAFETIDRDILLQKLHILDRECRADVL